MQWDIFCRVVDNHGDIGVCWRLAAELAERGEQVRLWTDDRSALAWMAPQGHAGVQVRSWPDGPAPLPGDVVIEAFGCDPPASYVAAMARRVRAPAWINLEYLSAEPFVERCHGLPSPVLSGPGRGLVKQFFYPGFSARTGGLLREHRLAERMRSFDADAWLRAQGVPTDTALRVSLFCYEPPALDDLLLQCAAHARPVRLLITPGRARAAVDAAVQRLNAAVAGWNAAATLTLFHLPLLQQPDYDHLLWSCDLNLVRGEDSLVRALLAGRPLVWQIYPQHDGAHHAKLEAFLDWLQPPPQQRLFHRIWNGVGQGDLPNFDVIGWATAAREAQARAWALPELTTQLQHAALELQRQATGPQARI